METNNLFCGVKLNPQLSSALKKLPSYSLDELFQSNSAYLQKFEFPEGFFIGKWIGVECTYNDIELLEQNIHSILKRFISDYNTVENPVYLLSGIPAS